MTNTFTKKTLACSLVCVLLVALLAVGVLTGCASKDAKNAAESANAKLAELDVVINDIKSTVNAINAENATASDVEAATKKLEGLLNDANGKIGDIQTQLGSLETNVKNEIATKLQAAVAEIKESVGADIADVSGKIDDILAKLDDVFNNLEASRAASEGVDAKYAELAEKIEAGTYYSAASAAKIETAYTFYCRLLNRNATSKAYQDLLANYLLEMEKIPTYEEELNWLMRGKEFSDGTIYQITVVDENEKSILVDAGISIPMDYTQDYLDQRVAQLADLYEEALTQAALASDKTVGNVVRVLERFQELADAENAVLSINQEIPNLFGFGKNFEGEKKTNITSLVALKNLRDYMDAVYDAWLEDYAIIADEAAKTTDYDGEEIDAYVQGNVDIFKPADDNYDALKARYEELAGPDGIWTNLYKELVEIINLVENGTIGETFANLDAKIKAAELFTKLSNGYTDADGNKVPDCTSNVYLLKLDGEVLVNEDQPVAVGYTRVQGVLTTFHTYCGTIATKAAAIAEKYELLKKVNTVNGKDYLADARKIADVEALVAELEDWMTNYNVAAEATEGKVTFEDIAAIPNGEVDEDGNVLYYEFVNKELYDGIQALKVAADNAKEQSKKLAEETQAVIDAVVNAWNTKPTTDSALNYADQFKKAEDALKNFYETVYDSEEPVDVAEQVDPLDLTQYTAAKKEYEDAISGIVAAWLPIKQEITRLFALIVDGRIALANKADIDAVVAKITTWATDNKVSVVVSAIDGTATGAHAENPEWAGDLAHLKAIIEAYNATKADYDKAVKDLEAGTAALPSKITMKNDAAITKLAADREALIANALYGLSASPAQNAAVLEAAEAQLAALKKQRDEIKQAIDELVAASKEDGFVVLDHADEVQAIRDAMEAFKTANNLYVDDEIAQYINEYDADGKVTNDRIKAFTDLEDACESALAAIRKETCLTNYQEVYDALVEKANALEDETIKNAVLNELKKSKGIGDRNFELLDGDLLTRGNVNALYDACIKALKGIVDKYGIDISDVEIPE